MKAVSIKYLSLFIALTYTCLAFSESGYGGADPATELVEKEFVMTSTGNCSTSIAGGTAFSMYGASGYYNHTIGEVDIIGELKINDIFAEAYSNGYFHESGVTDTKYQYAIVSNPKVLNGTYKRKSDNVNRLIMALGADPGGSTLKLFQFKRSNMAAGAYKVSFTLEDLVTASVCPQSNMPSYRQYRIVVYKNGTSVYDNFPQPSIGTSYNFTYKGSAAEGDYITVEVYARFMANCTAIAVSDLTIYGCLNKAIDTPTGDNIFCEGNDVTLMATGTSATTLKWESSPDNTNWTEIAGETGLKIEVMAQLGNTYYRFTEPGGSVSNVFSLLGQVCCTILEDQQYVWRETFGSSTEKRWTNDNVNTAMQRFRDYPGTIDDGYYAVVSNSSDANQNLDWPGGKTDHTGDENGGFLVINVNKMHKPPILIYSQTITPEEGFCQSTYYNLSLFASNIAPGGLPSSFMFEVKDVETGNILGQGNTGAINDFGMAHWLNYGTSFAPENSKSVMINIYNTGASGQGNDVVLDDISVSVCNIQIDLYANYPDKDVKNACGDAISLTTVANGNLMRFFGTETPYYLWTKSTDDGATWSIVEEASGQGSDSYITRSKRGSVVLYKLIVAAEEADARKIFNKESHSGCLIHSITNVSKIECEGGCYETPPEAEKPEYAYCDGEEIPTIKASYTGTGTNVVLRWFDSESSETPMAEGGEYTPAAPGKYYVEAYNIDEDCHSARTAIEVIKIELPVASIQKSHVQFTCDTTVITLKALPEEDMTYLWWNAATTSSVEITEPGEYSVKVTRAATSCSSEASITVGGDKSIVTVEVKPLLEACSPDVIDLKDAIVSKECEVVKYYSDPLLQQPLTETKITSPTIAEYYIQGENSNGCKSAVKKVNANIYELSLSVIKDTVIFEGGTAILWAYGTGVQAPRYTMQFLSEGKPVTEKVTGSVLKVGVTPADTTAYQLIAVNGTCMNKSDATIYVKPLSPVKIPKYFTPNGDGVNDVWHIINIEAFPNANIYIYDRFSKLLVKLKGSDAGWDGTYDGHPMPMDDYWYILFDEAIGTCSGHFILKR